MANVNVEDKIAIARSVMVASLLITLLASMCSGCSDLQRVCATGPETAYMTIAVEYWASQGEPVIMATDSECTVRTRVAEPPIPGEQWNGEIAVHKVYDLGVTELEPSHTIQTEIRIRESMWVQFHHIHRIYIAAHELGHSWHRNDDHFTWMPMLAHIPEDSVIEEWLKEAGLEQYIQEENLP